MPVTRFCRRHTLERRRGQPRVDGHEIDAFLALALHDVEHLLDVELDLRVAAVAVAHEQLIYRHGADGLGAFGDDGAADFAEVAAGAESITASVPASRAAASFFSSNSFEHLSRDVPMLAFTFVRSPSPMPSGSSPLRRVFLGMITRPAAIRSSRFFNSMPSFFATFLTSTVAIPLRAFSINVIGFSKSYGAWCVVRGCER